MKNEYPPLNGKCKEYIEKEKCLGCNRLELLTFTGDDNCKWIRECEGIQEEKQGWKIEGNKTIEGVNLKLW